MCMLRQNPKNRILDKIKALKLLKPPKRVHLKILLPLSQNERVGVLKAKRRSKSKPQHSQKNGQLKPEAKPRVRLVLPPWLRLRTPSVKLHWKRSKKLTL